MCYVSAGDSYIFKFKNIYIKVYTNCMFAHMDNYLLYREKCVEDLYLISSYSAQ